MSIRQVVNTVTVAAPGDPYGTLTTFTQGQVLDLAPGGAWETAIGASNVPVLSGQQLNNVLTGSDPADISNA
jgi:hypothetical protein